MFVSSRLHGLGIELAPQPTSKVARVDIEHAANVFEGERKSRPVLFHDPTLGFSKQPLLARSGSAPILLKAINCIFQYRSRESTLARIHGSISVQQGEILRRQHRLSLKQPAITTRHSR